ncbi:MAG: hypothetical protein MUC88_20140 [Planctomycetes bacterium]|nr:hypothetical protein [Planctomycetota bacterium]
MLIALPATLYAETIIRWYAGREYLEATVVMTLSLAVTDGKGHLIAARLAVGGRPTERLPGQAGALGQPCGCVGESRAVGVRALREKATA